jgi:hypothetical protein
LDELVEQAAFTNNIELDDFYDWTEASSGE